MPPSFHFTKGALALHLLLQHLERLINIVIPDRYFQGPSPFMIISSVKALNYQDYPIWPKKLIIHVHARLLKSKLKLKPQNAKEEKDLPQHSNHFRLDAEASIRPWPAPKKCRSYNGLRP